ncbi:MAG: hypothetical protein L0228_05215 [Planctomycetes bacterium]|nr:hypothetical protein [Planctomycetota bacterium]
MHQESRVSAIRRFFTGLTEYAFHARLGVADPPLVDYIGELLVRFVRCDELYPVRSIRGQRLVQVVDMLAEAQHREGPARQQVHRHIGDFTLFWTGVYPEVIDCLRRGGKDALIDYQQQGKRAYWIASTIPVEREAAPPDVLKRLSENFELCVYGLGEVRRQWEQQSGDADAPLLLG